MMVYLKAGLWMDGIVIYEYEERLALKQQYGSRIQADRTLHLMAKIRMKEQHCDEVLQYVREAVDIFRETGSRHLPEAEAMLEELQGLGISRDKKNYRD